MEVSQLAKDITETDYLRLLMIYFRCFEFSKNDRSTLLKSLPQDKHRQIVQNMEYIDESLVDKGSNKFKRRIKEQSKEDHIEYQRLRAQSEYDVLRMEPVLCTLLKQMHNSSLDTSEYPYVEEPKSTKKKDKEQKLIKGAIDNRHDSLKKDGGSYLENPRLFAFVLGGLSHHEMCSISELQKNLKA
jgi:hypothetical protein